MKLVVATDGSRGSRAALRFAARTAKGCRATEIVVVTVGALRGQLLFAHPEGAALAQQAPLARTAAGA